MGRRGYLNIIRAYRAVKIALMSELICCLSPVLLKYSPGEMKHGFDNSVKAY